MTGGSSAKSSSKKKSNSSGRPAHPLHSIESSLRTSKKKTDKRERSPQEKQTNQSELYQCVCTSSCYIAEDCLCVKPCEFCHCPCPK
ncbi:hypothetical protein L596_026156 [Steinernema carpocapsae]|uniref:Metallothionein n=1 Tax=Steinernema carpocapsae TaxID=34508 RepID=A0A4U5M0I9_STECR|nr:hypothetical protein L596_026156 [Steinernema carpocapsae]